jgi:regulator of CtrA degradation
MAFELKQEVTRAQKIFAFANSEVFEKIFVDGMDLVEETAHYLDNEGRHESKLLERTAALSYASESMRLTTRLMQAASWLLVQRAVKEGEMSAKDALDDKYRIGAKLICSAKLNPNNELPPRLVDLLIRSERLYTRIERLDTAMFTESEDAPAANVVNDHFEKLQRAFGSFGQIEE